MDVLEFSQRVRYFRYVVVGGFQYLEGCQHANLMQVIDFVEG